MGKDQQSVAAGGIGDHHPEVPRGLYCYERMSDPAYDAERRASGLPFVPGRFVPCPHHQIHADNPSQANGYCALLQQGDWDADAASLLWDSVKECGINENDPEMD